MNIFKGPMKPWPTLEQYSRIISLPSCQVDLFCFDTGPASGSTILMVHGLGDEADTWRYLIPELAPNHRILAPDLPGFGRSSRPSRALSPQYLVSVLLEMLEILAVPPVLLVGSSLGGLLCQQIALTEPKIADGLVLLDGTLIATGQAINLQLVLFMIPGVGEWLYNRLRKDPQEAFNTLQPYYADLEGMPKKDKEFLFQRVNERVWSDNQRSAYFSILRNLTRWSLSQQKKLPQWLSSCRVPTLAIWGELDRIVSIKAAKTLVQYQSSCQLVTLDGAGHLPHQEQPQAVLETLYQDVRLPIKPPV